MRHQPIQHPLHHPALRMRLGQNLTLVLLHRGLVHLPSRLLLKVRADNIKPPSMGDGHFLEVVDVEPDDGAADACGVVIEVWVGGPALEEVAAGLEALVVEGLSAGGSALLLLVPALSEGLLP